MEIKLKWKMLEAIAILTNHNDLFHLEAFVVERRSELEEIVLFAIDMVEAKALDHQMTDLGHVYTAPGTGEMVFAVSFKSPGSFRILFVFSSKSNVKFKDIKAVHQSA